MGHTLSIVVCPSSISVSFHVPEAVLKRRKAAKVAKVKADALKAVDNRGRRNKQKKVPTFQRAERLITKFRKAERASIALKRQAKRLPKVIKAPTGPDGSTLAVAIRIKGGSGVPPEVKKILASLRLNKIFHGVFLNLDSWTFEQLTLVSSFVIFGTPDARTARDLIYKRGFGRVNRERVPLTDNTVIEEALSSQNIICMEDIVHEVTTVGPNFKAAARFLWPFKLNRPAGTLARNALHESELGKPGFRTEGFSELLQKMM